MYDFEFTPRLSQPADPARPRRGDTPAEGPVIRFRNYQPKSEDLQGLAVATPEVPNVEEQVRRTATQALASGVADGTTTANSCGVQ